MTTFKGYYCIGCATKEEAQEGKGLLLWNEKVPSKRIQFFNKLLLNIFWVNKERNKENIQKGQNTTLKRNLPELIKK